MFRLQLHENYEFIKQSEVSETVTFKNYGKHALSEYVIRLKLHSHSIARQLEIVLKIFKDTPLYSNQLFHLVLHT